MKQRSLTLYGLLAALGMCSVAIPREEIRLHGKTAIVAITITGIWASQQHQQEYV